MPAPKNGTYEMKTYETDIHTKKTEPELPPLSQPRPRKTDPMFPALTEEPPASKEQETLGGSHER